MGEMNRDQEGQTRANGRIITGVDLVCTEVLQFANQLPGMAPSDEVR